MGRNYFKRSAGILRLKPNDLFRALLEKISICMVSTSKKE